MVRGLFGSLRGYKGDISPAAALDAVANQREPAPHFHVLCRVQLHAETAPARAPAGNLLSSVPAPAVSQHLASPGAFTCQAATNHRGPAASLLCGLHLQRMFVLTSGTILHAVFALWLAVSAMLNACIGC